MFHIDETPSGSGSGSYTMDSLYSASSTQYPICCLAASERDLFVARESGVIQRYSLPNVALVSRYTVSTKPFKMSVNCNST